jgi:hypothetical protein
MAREMGRTLRGIPPPNSCRAGEREVKAGRGHLQIMREKGYLLHQC